MEDCISWPNTPGIKEQGKCKELVQCLHKARNKLAPIVDNVILSTFHLMKKGDKEWFRKYTLTPTECQDIVWASQVLQECESTKKHRKCDLPNVNVIVNNVSLDSSKVTVRDKPVVIDEATMLELLDLYKKMGVVIQRMIAETARVENGKRPPSLEAIISGGKTSDRSISKTGNSASRQGTMGSVLELDESDRISSRRSSSSKHVKTPSGSATEIYEIDTDEHPDSLAELNEESDEDEINPPRKKSTLSALLDGSTEDLNDKTSEEKTPATTTDDEKKRDDEERKDDDDHDTSIFIKIKCLTDTSDGDQNEGMVIHCAKSCASQQHVKLTGDNVRLKMNKDNAEDGTVYCIDTGGGCSENEIRIIIKQCPGCKSTIIGSTTKIVDVLGESHESVTLHGKQGDEEKMPFSSDEDSARNSLKEDERCTCLQKGRVCTDLSKVRCEEFSSPCTCDEVVSDHSEPKMDVWIDADSVDKSTVKSHGEEEEGEEEEGEEEEEEEEEEKEGKEEKQEEIEDKLRTHSFASAKSSVDHMHEKQDTKRSSLKCDSGFPLTRRRVCSSMEFDVSTVHTRLRSQELEHHNAHVLIELKRLGVDNLLRACRPARCCRKAILNERQRTALPYCVSLRSLPLMNTDIQVIEQSIDMSVKKIKNATDLTQAQKDKLAYYVSLGRDDFKPDRNYPWVVPVYDMKLSQNEINKNKLVSLKETVGDPKQVGSATKLTKLTKAERKESHTAKNDCKCIPRKRYFILKRPTSMNLVSPGKCNFLQKLWTRGSGQFRKSKFKLQDKLSNDGVQDCVLKLLKYCQKSNIYSGKNVWSNITDDHCRLMFAQKHKQLGVNCMDVTFGEATMSKRQKEPTRDSSYKKTSHMVKFGTHKENSSAHRRRKNCRKPKTQESGDYSRSSLFDMCPKKLHVRKTEVFHKEADIDLWKGKSVVRFKSMPSVTKNLSNEIFYTSKAVTVLVKRTRSLENDNAMRISKITKIEEQWECISPKESPKPKKKLEYYVRLINGDLVWGNTLPLEPQKYETYYNHSNSRAHSSAPRDENRVRSRRTSRGDEVESTTAGQSQRNANSEDQRSNGSNVLQIREEQNSPTVASSPLAHFASKTSSPADRRSITSNDSERQDRRSTISEIKPEHFAELQNDPKRNTPSNQPSERSTKSEITSHFANIHEPARKLPPGFPPDLMGPESSDEPWTPLVVSDTSLPQIHEEVVEQELQEPVQAAPAEKPKPTRSGVCTRSTCAKRERPGDITIAIKQKNNKNVATSKPLKSCHKEICEIYKNKQLVSDKAERCGQPSSACDKRMTISGHDNFEIYVNNQKICLGSANCKKACNEATKKEKK